MPLSNKDLSDIAKEFTAAASDTTDTKSSIVGMEEQAVKTQAQADHLYIMYRNANNERVDPYQLERRWLDGTTYVPITETEINDSGNRTATNIFFPPTWKLNNAKLLPSGNGNITTISTNSESGVLNSTIVNEGLIAQIGLLRNGQSSGVGSRTLALSSYVPGATTINVNTTGNTNGKYLYLSGSGTSALVLITNVSGTVLTITEVIPPANTMAIGSSVVENIPGFTNGERNTLTSASYQRILTQLTSKIAANAALWNTSLSNQLTQLNLNIDSASQVNAAKASITPAQTAYSTWLALANTGVSGKYVDTSLNNLATAYNTRNSGISARVTQITTALGVVTQNTLGDYSGNGLFLQRYKCLNFLINGANGPLFQLLGIATAKLAFQQRVANIADKLTTFTNVVKCSLLTKNATGTNTIEVDKAYQFAPTDVILVNGTDLPSTEATIVTVVGSTVTLDKVIPVVYTKEAKASIIKRA
jgi:hypothetical protein